MHNRVFIDLMFNDHMFGELDFLVTWPKANVTMKMTVSCAIVGSPTPNIGTFAHQYFCILHNDAMFDMDMIIVVFGIFARSEICLFGA